MLVTLIVSALLLLIVGGIWWAPHTPYGRLDRRLAIMLKLGRFFEKFVDTSSFYEFSAQLRIKRNNIELTAKRKPYTPVAQITDVNVDAHTHKIPIRIYSPSTDPMLPILLYFHGGAWYFGNLDTHDAICRDLSIQCDAIVIAVDYRLAPEHPYPAAIEDAYSILEWLRNPDTTAPGNTDRISVAGDSSGANIATVLAILARDRLQLTLSFQALIYPVTNIANFTTDSYRYFATGYGLTKQDMVLAQSLYLPKESERSLPYASPLLSEDLSGLPATLIITAQFDILRDEGEAYAVRLQQAGNEVKISRYPGMIHGFVAVTKLRKQYAQAIAEIAQQFHCALSRQ